ncbi:MAG: hypothetical protein ICV87_01660 [Gemmatimonadetes bacterium]|nr:hypothetical protein [Gemmatimonadota bacterium]
MNWRRELGVRLFAGLLGAGMPYRVLDGSGSIEVALERDGCFVASEIPVTTPTEYEIGHLAKTLGAGFEHVVLVSTDQKTLTRVRAGALKALSPEQCACLSFPPPKRCRRFWTRSRPQSRQRRATDNGWRLNTKHARRRSELPPCVPCET